MRDGVHPDTVAQQRPAHQTEHGCQGAAFATAHSRLAAYLADGTLPARKHGKGADMGAAFGSGASGSLFGATGSANFLSRSTAVCAAVFFSCTLALAYLSNDRSRVQSGSALDAPAIADTPLAPKRWANSGGSSRVRNVSHMNFLLPMPGSGACQSV